MIQITRNTEVEKLIHTVPGSLSYLIAKGLCGIRCVEEISGTLGEAATEKGFSEIEIDGMLDKLNELTNNTVSRL